MQEKIVVHGNPNSSVFGLLGNDVSTDEGKLYVKVDGDSKNNGWVEIPPTPTPTQTISVTPTKTVIVTRTPSPQPSQFATSTPTISVTPTITPSSAPGSSPTPTPTPTSTPFKTQIMYTLVANGNGSLYRVDGDSPSGEITNDGTAEMQLQVVLDDNTHLNGWTVPESVILSNKYALNPVATGFKTVDDVTIIANIGDGVLPTKQIDGIAARNGVIEFDYVNQYGEEQSFILINLLPGQTYTNLTCGYIITRVSLGTVYLSTRSC
jgi:hypothetical protein